MSLTLRIAKKIRNKTRKNYLNSSTYRFFSFISGIYRRTALRKVYKTLGAAITSSFFARWLKRPERNIDVFEGSKIVNKKNIEGPVGRGEKIFKRGFFGRWYEKLYEYITKCPIRVVSLVVLGLIPVNMILGLFIFPLEMFNVFTFAIKVTIFFIALLGINIERFKKLKEGSVICKQFS